MTMKYRWHLGAIPPEGPICVYVWISAKNSAGNLNPFKSLNCKQLLTHGIVIKREWNDRRGKDMV